MSEAKLLETLGRKQLQLEAQQEEHNKLLNLLAGVVSGEIDRSRVLVNLTDRSWLFVEAGQRPPVPATINGKPVCIVAPVDPVREAIDALRNGRKAPETDDGAPITAELT